MAGRCVRRPLHQPGPLPVLGCSRCYACRGRCRPAAAQPFCLVLHPPVVRCCSLDQPPLRYKHCRRWCEGLAFFSKAVREELHCVQRCSPDRRGRLRLLGPWRDASTEQEPFRPVTVDGTAALVDRHAVWHHFHSICQEGQSPYLGTYPSTGSNYSSHPDGSLLNTAAFCSKIVILIVILYKSSRFLKYQFGVHRRTAAGSLGRPTGDRASHLPNS
eukprot:COSAG06_NODE_2389_length_6965_cov_6.611273_6_plen_216_part_00